MITHEHAGRTFLFVEVPEGSGGFTLPWKGFPDRLWYFDPIKKSTRYKLIKCIDAMILGKASELTEEQCQGIVKCLAFDDRWNNYSCDHPVWYHTAKQSLYSLLQSHSLQPENTLVLEVKK